MVLRAIALALTQYLIRQYLPRSIFRTFTTFQGQIPLAFDVYGQISVALTW